MKHHQQSNYFRKALQSLHSWRPPRPTHLYDTRQDPKPGRSRVHIGCGLTLGVFFFRKGHTNLVGGFKHFFPFHIWDNPSHWRTIIFQDAYCTTNQKWWGHYEWLDHWLKMIKVQRNKTPQSVGMLCSCCVEGLLDLFSEVCVFSGGIVLAPHNMRWLSKLDRII